MPEQDLRAEVIGFDSGWGSRDHGCEDGPLAVHAETVIRLLRERGVQAKWRGPLGLRHLASHDDLKTREDVLPVVAACLQRLAAHVRQTLQNGHIPIVIGGDHSCAIGTWSGAVAAAHSHCNFGLVWIDAHMDAHTPETSSQGKWGGWWHGQPVAALTGHGEARLVAIADARPKLAPRHITILGPHSFEPGESAFVEKHGIRVCKLDETRKRGFGEVFAEARARAAKGTDGFGLSIDLDAFQPADAPGVGTREDDGLASEEVLPIIRGLARHPGFRGLEIAEFNPHKDKNGRTRELVEKLIAAVFAKD